MGGGSDVSGAQEEPRIACTWCGLFSTPGFCDSCGSPLTTTGLAVEASDQASLSPATTAAIPPADTLPAEDDPLPDPVPVLAVGPFEEVPDAAEIFALVDDPAPLSEERVEPEPLETESLDTPRVETLGPEAETAPTPAPPLNLVDQKRDLPSDQKPEAETSQGPRCSSCGRAGRGGLCDTCREAIRELSGLSR